MSQRTLKNAAHEQDAHEQDEVQSMMALWDTLRRARAGEALPAEEVQQLVTYYEGLLAVLDVAAEARVREAMKTNTLAQQQQAKRENDDVRRAANQAMQAAQARATEAERQAAQLRRVIRRMAAHFVWQYGEWHEASRRAQLQRVEPAAAFLLEREA